MSVTSHEAKHAPEGLHLVDVRPSGEDGRAAAAASSVGSSTFVQPVAPVQQKNQPDKQLLREIQGKSVVLNEGSTARDHLANERTYLAWLRTSLGATGIGVALSQFSVDDEKGKNAGKINGLLFVVLGIVILMYSTYRYFRVAYLLEQGYFHVSRRGIVAASIVIIGLLITGLLIILIK